MDEFLERLEKLEKVVEGLLAHKPKEVVVLTEPKALKARVREKRELLEAIKKLKKTPHHYILINQLALLFNLKSYLNTENTEKKYNTEEVLNIFNNSPLDSKYFPKLTDFIEQVAAFNLDLIKTPEITPKHELEKFCTYYLNVVDVRNRPMFTKHTSWIMAFRNWCKKAKGFNKSHPYTPNRYQDEISRRDYEEREKRENGYEGGSLTIGEAFEEYEAEFLQK